VVSRSKRIYLFSAILLVLCLGGLGFILVVKVKNVAREVERHGPDLDHRERGKRVEAAVHLSRFCNDWGAGPGRARKDVILEKLLDGLEDVDVKVRTLAAEGLAAWGLEARDALRKALTSPDEEMRVYAAYALSLYPIPDLILELRNVLRDSRVELRVYATEALGSMELNQVDDEMVCDVLYRVWRDNDRWVQNAAAEAMFKLGYWLGIPILVKNVGEGNFWQRFNAYERLTRIYRKLGKFLPPFYADGHAARRKAEVNRIKEVVFNDREIHRRIIENLPDDKNLMFTISRWILNYLGKYGVPSLVEAMETSPKKFVRVHSAQILAELTAPELPPPLRRDNLPVLQETPLPALIRALDQENTDVVLYALMGVGNYGSEADVDAVIPFLTSRSADLRISAVRALGKIGGEKALVALTALEATGETAEVRDQAVEWIRKRQ